MLKHDFLSPSRASHVSLEDITTSSVCVCIYVCIYICVCVCVYVCVCVCVEGVQQYSANPHAVFTNNEFSMKYIDVYGFDMDYTLVQYTTELHKYTYKMALNALLSELNVRTHAQCSM